MYFGDGKKSKGLCIGRLVQYAPSSRTVFSEGKDEHAILCHLRRLAEAFHIKSEALAFGYLISYRY